MFLLPFVTLFLEHLKELEKKPEAESTGPRSGKCRVMTMVEMREMIS